jgi:thioredoxin-like negative regulator of GroEL
MNEEEKKLEIEQIVDELPILLVAHAYRKLKSGKEISSSEMKVCLDICKTYAASQIVEKAQNILDELPFDVEE